MTTNQNAAIFSSDLQTFIVTKYDPLLTIVKELNDKLQNSEKDKYRLEKRLMKLERQVVVLLDKLEVTDVTDVTIDREGRENKAERKINQQIESEENLLTPWLFSCQMGTPLSSLQVLLEFSNKNTVELNVRLWKREEDMWVNFLQLISSNDQNYLPQSLTLMDLRKATRKCLLTICTNEVLIVLRNVPGKSQAIYNTATMTLVAILASAIYEAWKRIELTDPVSLGRVVLVLDGEDVGSRLRAGNKKLKIEPLN
ncbi:conserved protein, unknown function [Plasmodium vivax]|uniref:Apicomplexan specific coiled coil protein n=4 Tax=Plasmodium vivax TaxID=5855 RepID=A5K9M6_PLAVS|nr:hypothetical protein, conserved [Plasmodium vivax]KMZ86327.1 hypothetical protein PVBG_01850 [Plasmodium vivax Brazil I]KMZ92687.1 hypothetical protein PVMG_01275 [Plasmodium vivax Mauritania I]EDL44098.1 hypothetical protein, conserved [Plasmodium vivax]CAI7721003.1 conserved protein, unknown function [Plasmodium vivax]SCO67767.1 conserved Plasmodium protein, unknown function [Plasmodium vivax]|eukprot:XP_001613825.1 hypothetical protein [Plasmodium vivax Sal-1]